MDVERIQKINNLALDLMKQGLADTREAAIAQAEKVFEGETAEQYSEFREQVQDFKKEPAQEKQASEDLSQDQIKDILQQNSAFLVKKIKSFEEQISGMEKQLSELRMKLNRQQLPSASQVMSSKEPVVQELEEAPAPEPVAQVKQEAPVAAPAARNDAPNHPRSGNYSDTDVSIEKFFYMGSK